MKLTLSEPFVRAQKDLNAEGFDDAAAEMREQMVSLQAKMRESARLLKRARHLEILFSKIAADCRLRRSIDNSFAKLFRKSKYRAN